MIEKLPDEIITPILEAISYILTFLTGILAKWLQGRNRNKKPPVQ